jgi:hypothetical protein
MDEDWKGEKDRNNWIEWRGIEDEQIRVENIERTLKESREREEIEIEGV